MSEGVRIRGAATAEEIAAVLAVVRGEGRTPAAETPYRRWRSTRLTAVRRAAS